LEEFRLKPKQPTTKKRAGTEMDTGFLLFSACICSSSSQEPLLSVISHPRCGCRCARLSAHNSLAEQQERRKGAARDESESQ
jgi:hypothetical protein